MFNPILLKYLQFARIYYISMGTSVKVWREIQLLLLKKEMNSPWGIQWNESLGFKIIFTEKLEFLFERALYFEAKVFFAAFFIIKYTKYSDTFCHDRSPL